MMYEILKTDFKFKDIRGSLTQLAHNGWEQINVLITHKDVFRGGHYHKKTKEAFYVISGELVVTFTDKNGKSEKQVFHSGDFFMIYPFVSHSMDFREETVMVAMYDKCVVDKNGEKDIFAETEK